jgi:hypothetical protein
VSGCDGAAAPRLAAMGDAHQRGARTAFRKAQADYERDVAKAREARRKSFERAQKAGMSLRAIGEEAGLHHTRVGEILRGK